MLAGIPAGALEADLRTDPARITGAIRQALLSNARRLANAPGLGPAPGPVVVDLDTSRQHAEEPGTGPLTAEQAPAGPRLVLIVDQFEEVFTQCADEQERRAFIRALCAAAGTHTFGIAADSRPSRWQVDTREAPALVVIGIRADFYSRCAAYPELVPHLQDHQVLVGPLTEAGLREAIGKPAAPAGLAVDAALVEVLLSDLGLHPRLGATLATNAGNSGGYAAIDTDSYEVGKLALLSYALQQTWRNREGRRLTVAGYRATGAIDGAVAQAADKVYNNLAPAGQDTLRRVLLRLVALGEDTSDSRRRVTLAELTSSQYAVRDTHTRVVLADLIDARLVTADADTIEITHETLLTAWPRLHQWLTDDRTGLRVHRDLTDAARDWQHHSRDPGRLFRGTRLTAAKDWAAQHDQDLNADEHAFLAASQHDQLRTTRRRHAVIAGLLALTLAAGTAAGIAAHNAATAAHAAATANRQHAIALSRQLAATSLSISSADPVIARQIAVAAWVVFPTAQASSIISTLLARRQPSHPPPASPSPVRGVAFSPKGTLLASADGDGTVRLWNPATGRPVGAPLPAGDGSGVNGVAFSPNGTLLASAYRNGTVRLWNPATGYPVGSPLRAGSYGSCQVCGVNAVAFSPNGKLLASADGDGTVRLWNPATGHPVGAPLPAGGDIAEGVAFSPNGRLLASADGDGTVRLWNPATGRPVGAPLRAANSIDGASAVAFSPNGKLLATADGNGMVQLWNPATGQRVGAPLPADSDPSGGGVNAVAFSPNGKLLATADANDTVRLWNSATGHPVGAPLPARGGGEGVSGVAFSPNGKLLASADGDGTVRLWNPATGRSVGAPLPAETSQAGFGARASTILHADTCPGCYASGVAFSPNGKLLASAGADSFVRLWNPATGHLVGAPLFAGGAGPVNGVAFSPNGKLLATADADGTVRLWNPATGNPVGAPLPADSSLNGGVNAVAFSPNGRLLATADTDGTVRLWNPATGNPVGAPLPAGVVGGASGVAFSPNGRLLATADTDGTVRLWNPATSAPVLADTGFYGGVSGVAFSPNGKLLASASRDGTVRLWNPATGHLVGAPLPAGGGRGVHGVAFSPNGKLLATADADGTVRLWNPATGHPVGVPLLASASEAVYGVAFSPDGRLLASAYRDGNVRLWEVWLFAHPRAALCADVGPPTRQEWRQYAAGEPQPNICNE